MQKQSLSLVRKNDNEEVRKILLKYIKKSKKFRYRLIKFFYYYKRSFAIMFLILIISLMLFLLILISGFTFTRITEIFSIAALILSLTNIMYRITQLKDYAVEDLEIKNLKDDLYEINFLIKNAGYGKLKLDFAFYSIENRDISESNDFFYCSSMKMHEYFGNLLNKLDNTKDEEMELFSLESMQKEREVFFTHEEFSVQTRLKKFKQNKLYKVTFFFQTSKKVNYEISRYVIT